MKLIVALLILATSAMAQAPTSHAMSPAIGADRSLTFRFAAPAAKEVVLRCEAVTTDGLPQSQPMQKDDGGAWTFRTGPVAPDIYTYSITVDGQRVLDPANPYIKYNLFNTENLVHVPGADLPWEIKDVPHGVVHRHLYRSTIIGAERNVWVYTPPGYDPKADRTYPVLYLLHGFSDVESTWVDVGRANLILDNLIAEGKAQPMLIVMPLGYGNREVVARGWSGVRSGSGTDAWNDSNEKFGKSLVQEIVPLVEQNYRVVANPGGRAIAGLSMGGTQSLLIGLGSPDEFAWIGAFSAGGMPSDYRTRLTRVNDQLNRDLRLLWIGCGVKDRLIAPNRELSAWLKSKGVQHTFVESPGWHSFLVWRRYLADFAPLLFQPGK